MSAEPVFPLLSSAAACRPDDARTDLDGRERPFNGADDPFGRIAPARLFPGRALLVGQALGADGDDRPITGAMGERLATLAGLADEDEPGCPATDLPLELRLSFWYDRVNLLAYFPGRAAGQKGHAFPAMEARKSAVALAPHLGEYREIVFCGRAVCDAFAGSVGDGQAHAWRRQPPLRPQRWRTFSPNREALLSWVPHPSGIVIWWNDPQNVAAAERHMRASLARVRAS